MSPGLFADIEPSHPHHATIAALKMPPVPQPQLGESPLETWDLGFPSIKIRDLAVLLRPSLADFLLSGSSKPGNACWAMLACLAHPRGRPKQPGLGTAAKPRSQ